MNAHITTDPLVSPTSPEYKPWSPFLVRGAVWQEALHRRLTESADPFGRRELAVWHPDSGDIPSIAPGIQARFAGLPPQARTLPMRSNASYFCMVIRGSLEVTVDGQAYELSEKDSWVVPGMRSWSVRNTGDAAAHYIVYSNAPLLQKLGVHFELPGVAQDSVAMSQDRAGKPSAKELAGPGHTIDDSGAQLLPYEHLVDPEFESSRPLVWRWSQIAPHLPTLNKLHDRYDGRPLWILYNPATQHRVGTTPCFFATIFSSRANRSTPSHRHASAAVNFILNGAGYSDIGGRKVEWSAGDIMLSAPGWVEHSHHILEDQTEILTIQDHPLHISMESLLWQERLPDGPLMTLGTQRGFETNLAASADA